MRKTLNSISRLLRCAGSDGLPSDSMAYLGLDGTRAYCRHVLTLDAELRRIRGQRIAADPNRVFSWLDDLPARVIEEGQLIESQREAYLPRFSRCERHPQKSLQAAHRLFEAGSPVADVTLHHFRPGSAAGILHSSRGHHQSSSLGSRLLQQDRIARKGDARIPEGGVRKAEAEGKQCRVWSVDI